MSAGVFVTGGSGFVGTRLLAALQGRGRPVHALDRSGSILMRPLESTRITAVRGDLLEPGTYRQALSSCDVVLHLAAATGRASAEEHLRVNARGTEVLLGECRRAGVQRVLMVSSIAASFPDTTGYPYAQAKVRAEAAVRRSGLRFAILRPTIVLGHGAPTLKALETLALLPLIVLPGNGRVRVQPIHVDDLVRFILAAVDRDLFVNETFEIGGPEAVTMEELLHGLREARTGGAGRILHIPLGLLQPPLRLAEAMGLGRVLPISAGQLSSFRFDGIAAQNTLQEDLKTGLIGVRQMLSGVPRETAAAASPLDAECRVFTRHLLGCDPDDYARSTYAAAHMNASMFTSGDRFDDALVAFARVHHLCARVADSYASVFAPRATLRKKLVLLLAILETHRPFYGMIDRAIEGSTFMALIRLAARVVAAVASLVVGATIFLPVRFILALARRQAR